MKGLPKSYKQADGSRWMTPQQVTVWVGELLREAEACGIDRATVVECVLIAVGAHLAKDRRKRNRESWDAVCREMREEKLAHPERFQWPPVEGGA